MSRTTSSKLLTACTNRGIEVERKHKQRIELRPPGGPPVVCTSITNAWVRFQEELSQLPLARPAHVQPIRL